MRFGWTEYTGRRLTREHCQRNSHINYEHTPNSSVLSVAHKVKFRILKIPVMLRGNVNYGFRVRFLFRCVCSNLYLSSGREALLRDWMWRSEINDKTKPIIINSMESRGSSRIHVCAKVFRTHSFLFTLRLLFARQTHRQRVIDGLSMSLHDI